MSDGGVLVFRVGCWQHGRRIATFEKTADEIRESFPIDAAEALCYGPVEMAGLVYDLEGVA